MSVCPHPALSSKPQPILTSFTPEVCILDENYRRNNLSGKCWKINPYFGKKKPKPVKNVLMLRTCLNIQEFRGPGYEF